MVKRNYFSHYALNTDRSPAPRGSEPFHRAQASDYAFWDNGVGEILHYGSLTPRKALEGWMKSKGHCAEVVGPFDQIGLGVYRDPASIGKRWTGVSTSTVWATTFGRTTPRGPDSPEVAKARAGCPYKGLVKAPAPDADIVWSKSDLKAVLVDGKVEVSGSVIVPSLFGPKPQVTVTLINAAKQETTSRTVDLPPIRKNSRPRLRFKASLQPRASDKSWTVRVRMVGVSDPFSEITRSLKR